MYNAPLIAGNHEQEKEYFTRKILKFFPDRENDPALLYGDSKLEYLRLVNEGLIPDEAHMSDVPFVPETPRIPPVNQSTNLLWDWPRLAGWELDQGDMKHPKGGDTYIFNIPSWSYSYLPHGLIPFDPRREYQLSLDVTADTPGTVIYVSMDYRDINGEAIAVGSGNYIVNQFEVPSTGWHNFTLDVRTHSTLPDNAYYITPVLFTNHQNGVQGGTQWVANFRLEDVTATRRVPHFDGSGNVATVLPSNSFPFGSVAVDTHKAMAADKARYIVPITGVYTVNASVGTQSVPVGTLLRMYLVKNAQQWVAMDREVTSVAGTTQLIGSASILANKGEVLEIQILVGSGATGVTATTGRVNTALQITWIG